MSKSIEHIIPMLVQIEENFSRLYNNVASIDGQYNAQLKTAAMVLSRQEKEHADYYRKLLIKMEGTTLTVEDGMFYNIKKVLDDFKKGIQKESHANIKSLLEYAISFEKRNGDVLKAIKNNVTGEGEESMAFINLLNELIEAEIVHSNTLSSFLPK